jgi:hypothetical protein
MAALKTKPTAASVRDYIDARASDAQRADIKALMALFRRVTGRVPKMWGPSIVGYGSYQYRAGQPGEMPVAAFAIRGRDLVVYLTPGAGNQKALLSKLGKHSMGKSCLHIRKLADVDTAVLEQLVVESLAGGTAAPARG